ncbi:MAG: hypothetical protein RLY16_2194 [Bacteroidota bacterium]
MTISNETKIGSLTAISIVLLILGFNFLKGKSIKGTSSEYIAVFSDVQGLATSNPVVINGKDVGNVASIDGGRDMRNLKVTLVLKEEVDIPDDSYAIITKSLLGGAQLDIHLGNSKKLLASGATLKTIASNDLIGDAMKKLDPVLYEVTNAVHSLDTLLSTVTTIFDPASKANIRNMLDNLNKTTASLALSSASLQTMLQEQTGAIAKSMDNVSSITGNLKNNNDKIAQSLSNVQTITDKLAKLQLEETIATLNQTMSALKLTLQKANSDSGSMGLLLNDPKLYQNLTATTNKLNVLLDDVRLHPKRYINVSVFGKKDKTAPLTVALPDTVNAPYLPK